MNALVTLSIKALAWPAALLFLGVVGDADAEVVLVLWIRISKVALSTTENPLRLTFPVAEPAVPDAVPTVVDMVAVLVVSFEAPVALITVTVLDFAEDVSKRIEEVCTEAVVATSELFVSERVVLIDSLDGIPVEKPIKTFIVSASLF